ncbi:MAG: hypothetical protein U0230_05645 [Polyangiales bacterium]
MARRSAPPPPPRSGVVARSSLEPPAVPVPPLPPLTRDDAPSPPGSGPSAGSGDRIDLGLVLHSLSEHPPSFEASRVVPKAPAATAQPADPAARPRGPSRRVGLVVLALVLPAAGFALTRSTRPEGERPAAAAAAPPTTGVEAPAAIPPATPPEAASAAPAPLPSVPAAPPSTSTGARRAPAPRSAATPIDEPSPREASVDDATLPEVPERAEVLAGLQAVHDAVAACTEGHGSAVLHVTIAGSGRVTTAFATGHFAGTPEGSCMARAVRAARFPRFTRPTITVEYPFQLH